MDELRAEIRSLSAKVDQLSEFCARIAEDAERKNDYLFGLRDAIGAVGKHLTGLNLGVVLIDRKPEATRWTANSCAVVWVEDSAEILSPSEHGPRAPVLPMNP